MQALKAVVGALTILIVLAITAIGWGLYRKASDPDFSVFGSKETETPAPAAAMPNATPNAAPNASSHSTPNTAFGSVTLDLPAGCRVADVRPDGSRLYVLVESEGADCPAVVVVDSQTGTRLGTLKERP